jgi:hypothetical protein
MTEGNQGATASWGSQLFRREEFDFPPEPGYPEASSARAFINVPVFPGNSATISGQLLKFGKSGEKSPPGFRQFKCGVYRR